MKEYFIFFDEFKMPLAVFLTEKIEESIELFEILYREKWGTSQARGISVFKESEVAKSEWDRIHEQRALSKKNSEPTFTIPKITLTRKPFETQSLETSKYFK